MVGELQRRQRNTRGKAKETMENRKLKPMLDAVCTIWKAFLTKSASRVAYSRNVRATSPLCLSHRFVLGLTNGIAPALRTTMRDLCGLEHVMKGMTYLGGEPSPQGICRSLSDIVDARKLSFLDTHGCRSSAPCAHGIVYRLGGLTEDAGHGRGMKSPSHFRGSPSMA